jgi:hypothetical protein
MKMNLQLDENIQPLLMNMSPAIIKDMSNFSHPNNPMLTGTSVDILDSSAQRQSHEYN